MTEQFSANALKINAAAECERLAAQIRKQIAVDLKRKGAVLGLSGGIDSSVAAALCVRAVGPDRVLGLLMPEMDSSADSLWLGQMVADQLGIETILEDITSILESTGCYRRRDEAIRMVIPEYTAGHRCKIVSTPSTHEGGYAVFSAITESPTGETTKARLTPLAYRGVVAATNFKQRVRKMLEYFYVDRLNYAVAGTPNLLEYDQGFFVKNGDGAADFKPIAHLYKTQVYQLAAALGVPEAIRQRPPTTDTYSLSQSQEEFYFSLPYTGMDACLYARDHGVPAAEVAVALALQPAQVERVWKDIEAKRAVARYLHSPPLTLS